MRVEHLRVDDVFPNADQPRTVFDQRKLEELAASIRAAGQLQPIVVRPTGAGKFSIVMGERRWRPMKLIGASTIRAEVRDMSDDELADQAIIENLQRADITPLEEAKAYQRRLDSGLTVEELAKRLGIRQPHRITERTSLLRLRIEFQDALAKAILTPSQAYEMSRLTSANQVVLFNAIRDGKCSSYAELRRTTEALLASEKQSSMFATMATPTAEARATVGRFEAMVCKVVDLLNAGFDGNECVVVQRVNASKAEIIADQLELAEKAIREMRLALRAAAIAGGRAA